MVYFLIIQNYCFLLLKTLFLLLCFPYMVSRADFFSSAMSSATTSSSSTSSTINSSSSSFPMGSLLPHQFTIPITLKLDNDNFLLWKQQVLATIRGLNLEHFLDGSGVPDRYLPSTAGQPLKPNDAYLHYTQQDHLIVAWLLASMTSTVLTKMVGLEKSTDIWKRLCTSYASRTMATIKKLKLLLKTPKMISLYPLILWI